MVESTVGARGRMPSAVDSCAFREPVKDSIRPVPDEGRAGHNSGVFAAARQGPTRPTAHNSGELRLHRPGGQQLRDLHRSVARSA